MLLLHSIQKNPFTVEYSKHWSWPHADLEISVCCGIHTISAHPHCVCRGSVWWETKINKFGPNRETLSLNLLISSSSPLAPGPVQNLTVTFLSESATYNRTTRTYDIPVSISWQPPEYPNGEIVAYSYRLVETNAPNTNIILDMNTTQLSIQRSVTVAPFTNYTATVVAFTSAGSGESVMNVALSPEAGNVEQDSRFSTFVSGRTVLFFTFCVVKEIGQFECVKWVQTAIVACIELFITWS